MSPAVPSSANGRITWRFRAEDAEVTVQPPIWSESDSEETFAEESRAPDPTTLFVHAVPYWITSSAWPRSTVSPKALAALVLISDWWTARSAGF
jgi:hypothetical protein